MLKLLIFGCLLTIATTNPCRNVRIVSQPTGDICVRDPCIKNSEVVSPAPPTPCLTHCMRNGSDPNCYLKVRRPRVPMVISREYEKNLSSQARAAASEGNGTGGVTKRLYGIGGTGGGTCPCQPQLPPNIPPSLYAQAPVPPGFPLPPGISGGQPDLFNSILGGYGNHRFTFPHNCVFGQSQLQLPCNIPYCLRIACRDSDPTLELNPQACLAIPGCYFDNELHCHRQFNPRLLGGIPVCHLVVRNYNFQRLAQNYMQQSRQPWNPFFTDCMVSQNLPALLEPPVGCQSLRFLSYIGVYPKVAGWRGITQRCCAIIGGCWHPTSGSDYSCFYPSESNGVQVRAGKDPHRGGRQNQISQGDLFGQPLCRPFDSSSPTSYLNSYHQCRQAGCVTDSSISGQSLLQQFLQYTLSSAVPVNVRLSFWQGVQGGTITPANYVSSLQNLINRPVCPSLNPFLPPTVDYFYNVLQPLSLNLKQQQQQVSRRNFALGQPSFNCPQVAQSQLYGFNPQLIPSLVGGLCGGNPHPNYGCPYTAPPYNPALSGSFEGCCEKHLCYIPRTLTTQQRSGVAAYTGEWGDWGPCSKSCGKGSRMREKKCIKHEYDTTGCDESEVLTQTSDCNTHSCPAWGPYSDWSSCSVTCGDGQETRTRVCLNPDPKIAGGGCEGDATESRDCSTGCACPTTGGWGDWSACPCDVVGVPSEQSRSRSCTADCTCNGQAITDEVETRVCSRICAQNTCQVYTCSSPSFCIKRAACTCSSSTLACNDYELPFWPSQCAQPPTCFEQFWRTVTV